MLSSFINHSCLSNTSRIEVGSAMFIHASKTIKGGEEITISYFDTLVPLLQRQAMCKSWGFK
jgi:SET domain-containing protein